MREDGLLQDDISFMGPKATSIFTDEKGHQGKIALQAGTLLWLNNIYQIDLYSNNYETGFDTNLHGIATEISNNHNTVYKL